MTAYDIKKAIDTIDYLKRRHIVEGDSMQDDCDLAITRLRADLAKLDGPAPGTRRVYLIVEDYGGHNHLGAFASDVPNSLATRSCTIARVIVDIPVPVPPVVRGEVIP